MIGFIRETDNGKIESRGVRPILAVIPARGGSKGIPRKALAPLAGRPLLAWSVSQALRLRRKGLLDRVVVSTEDRRIAAEARRGGAEVLSRPTRLATDRATGLDVLRHAVRALSWEGTVVLLQPTSPLRDDADVGRALRLFARRRPDAVVSVSAAHPPPEWTFRMGRGGWLAPVLRRPSGAGRQGLEPAVALNGAVYVVSSGVLLSRKGILGGRVLGFPMPAERSVDIDTPTDLVLAESLMRRKT